MPRPAGHGSSLGRQTGAAEDPSTGAEAVLGGTHIIRRTTASAPETGAGTGRPAEQDAGNPRPHAATTGVPDRFDITRFQPDTSPAAVIGPAFDRTAQAARVDGGHGTYFSAGVSGVSLPGRQLLGGSGLAGEAILRSWAVDPLLLPLAVTSLPGPAISSAAGRSRSVSSISLPTANAAPQQISPRTASLTLRPPRFGHVLAQRERWGLATPAAAASRPELSRAGTTISARGVGVGGAGVRRWTSAQDVPPGQSGRSHRSPWHPESWGQPSTAIHPRTQLPAGGGPNGRSAPDSRSGQPPLWTAAGRAGHTARPGAVRSPLAAGPSGRPAGAPAVPVVGVIAGRAALTTGLIRRLHSPPSIGSIFVPAQPISPVVSRHAAVVPASMLRVGSLPGSATATGPMTTPVRLAPGSVARATPLLTVSAGQPISPARWRPTTHPPAGAVPIRRHRGAEFIAAPTGLRRTLAVSGMAGPAPLSGGHSRAADRVNPGLRAYPVSGMAGAAPLSGGHSRAADRLNPGQRDYPVSGMPGSPFTTSRQSLREAGTEPGLPVQRGRTGAPGRRLGRMLRRSAVITPSSPAGLGAVAHRAPLILRTTASPRSVVAGQGSGDGRGERIRRDSIGRLGDDARTNSARLDRSGPERARAGASAGRTGHRSAAPVVSDPGVLRPGQLGAALTTQTRVGATAVSRSAGSAAPFPAAPVPAAPVCAAPPTVPLRGGRRADAARHPVAQRHWSALSGRRHTPLFIRQRSAGPSPRPDRSRATRRRPHRPPPRGHELPAITPFCAA